MIDLHRKTKSIATSRLRKKQTIKCPNKSNRVTIEQQERKQKYANKVLCLNYTISNCGAVNDVHTKKTPPHNIKTNLSIIVNTEA